MLCVLRKKKDVDEKLPVAICVPILRIFNRTNRISSALRDSFVATTKMS